MRITIHQTKKHLLEKVIKQTNINDNTLEMIKIKLVRGSNNMMIIIIINYKRLQLMIFKWKQIDNNMKKKYKINKINYNQTENIKKKN